MRGFIINTTGNKREFAYIAVKYPAGSTCTCYNAEKDKTLTAENTSGSWSFAVPYAGTWVVSSTNGTMTDSETVNITTKGQSLSVELKYEFIVFANGKYVDIGSMAGMSLSGGNLVLTATGSNSNMNFKVSSSNIAIKVDDYRILRVNMRWVNNLGRNATYRRGGVGLTSSKHTSISSDSPSIYAVSKIVQNNGGGAAVDGVYDIDISKLYGNYYFTTYTTAWGDQGETKTTVMTLRDVRLIP